LELLGPLGVEGRVVVACCGGGCIISLKSLFWIPASGLGPCGMGGDVVEEGDVGEPGSVVGEMGGKNVLPGCL